MTEMQVKCDPISNIITLQRSDNIATIKIAYLMISMSEQAQDELSLKYQTKINMMHKFLLETLSFDKVEIVYDLDMAKIEKLFKNIENQDIH